MSLLDRNGDMRSTECPSCLNKLFVEIDSVSTYSCGKYIIYYLFLFC